MPEGKVTQVTISDSLNLKILHFVHNSELCIHLRKEYISNGTSQLLGREKSTNDYVSKCIKYILYKGSTPFPPKIKSCPILDRLF